MNKSLLSLILLGALTSLTASAAQAAGVGATAELGTTGIGAHIVVPVSEQWNARFGVNALDYNYSTTANLTDYDFKLRMQTFDALLDYYPAAGSFRVTGGLAYNNNKIDGTAKPSAGGTYTFNGTTYSAASAGSVNGTVDFNKAAPYLGIGWGNAVAKNKGWGFTADVGVLFQGSPRTTLTNSGCTAGPACAALASDLAAETAKVNDKASNFKYLPVVRVGITYRF